MHVRIMFPLLIAMTVQANAQEHRHHPAADMALHEKFYSTWYMPDQPTRSCCNMADCYPTEVPGSGRPNLRPSPGGWEMAAHPGAEGGAQPGQS